MCADGLQHLVGDRMSADRVGQAELHGEASEAAHLVVGPKEQDVDADDHACDGLIADPRKRLLTELAEGQIGAIAEVEHLEVVGTHLIEVLDQRRIAPSEIETREEAAMLGDSGSSAPPLGAEGIRSP